MLETPYTHGHFTWNLWNLVKARFIIFDIKWPQVEDPSYQDWILQLQVVEVKKEISSSVF